MASSQVLSETLYAITSIKLDQLDKQRSAYESAKRSLLDDATLETNDRKRAKILVEGAEKLPTMAALKDSPMISLSNLKRFVEQAEHDPSVSTVFIADCEQTLRKELDVQSSKYDFAELYGKLVNEWISAGKLDDSDSEAGFVPVGREQMHEQRATWEGLVFAAKDTDQATISAYLDELFKNSSKDVARSYKTLVEDFKAFQKHWDKLVHFDEYSLQNTIRGLLRSDLLTDQKRSTLTDFLGNSVVLQEIADVLNMRMTTRKTWSWDSVSFIEQRRQLNGRYRFYPDEDLLQAIFLHYIGRRWGYTMKEYLIAFTSRQGVVKPAAQPMDKEDIRRRRFFLGEVDATTFEREDTVEAIVTKHFADDIFLDQMPDNLNEERGGYGEENSDVGDTSDTRKSHVAVVQGLLHLIQSDIIMQTRLGKEVTVIRSDFKWFGPSAPHSSLLAVLRFFGVTEEWLQFFQKVLEAPLQFRDDPQGSEPQIRRRGIPVSTPLADLLTEAMLFCLDFAANRQANGARLYRLHDDMWLWGSVETCAKSWETVLEFTDLMGLEINKDKTGSARILRDGSTPRQVSALPKGDVIWGFLKLDPATGRFLLDEKKVDEHIEELRHQLAGCKSVFDWIQAWNIYGCRFFSTNFGKLANCYSREHVDSMLAMFHRIQAKLFGDSGVGAYVKKMISERFWVHDVPDGYLHFPVTMGGLGLQNPFIPLNLIRGKVKKRPDKIMDKFFEEEEAEYRRLKAKFEGAGDGHGSPDWSHRSEFADLRDTPFFSLEEFTRYRERTSASLGAALEKLRAEPEPVPLEAKGDVMATFGRTWFAWENMSDEDKWVCSLYAKDMIARFGSLTIVDKGLLPMGLMAMLRRSRFKWQG